MLSILPGIRWLPALGIVFLSTANYARQLPPPDDGVFRVNSTLVQVDAVVTDSKGRQVSGLTASDFDIYADGKLQKITRFSYVSVSPQGGSFLSAKTAPDIPSLAPPPSSNLRRADVRRTIVLMVDDLNLSFESLAFVRAALLKFIDQQVQPGDLIAVCKTGAGSSAFQQFTPDRRIARAIVSRLRWNPNGIGSASFLAPYGRDSDLRTPDQKARTQDVRDDSPNPRGTDAPTVDSTSVPSGGVSSQFDNLRRNTMTAGALGALDYVIQALREMPGRKSVILFSDGFNLDRGDDRVMNAMRRLIDRANRSGTVIYTMHTAGLQVLLPTANDNPNLSKLKTAQEVEQALSAMNENRSEELFNAQAGLDYLAAVTGGFPYLNGNDLNFGLARVMEEQRGYYLLAYSPPPGTFDEKNGERTYHKLKVLLKDKALTIRSRSGFFGVTDEEAKPQYRDSLQQLRATMLSPFTSSGIRLRLTPIYTEIAGHGPVIRNLLDIDTRDLSFTALPDGSSQGRLKLVVAAYGLDNKLLKLFGTDYKFSVPADKRKQAERDGVLYTINIDLPKPGGVQIRAAVLDESTAKTGSAHEYLDVPDVRKRPVSLTSLVLADAASSQGSETMSLGASAARRQFPRGGILQYFCMISGAAAQSTRAHNVSAQIRIVRDDKQILFLPVKVKELADRTRAVSGQLKLGAGLPPGDYFLQVIATAHGAGRPAVVDEWANFEIVP